MEIKISMLSTARRCVLNYFSLGNRSDLTLSPQSSYCTMSFNFNFLLHHHRELFVFCVHVIFVVCVFLLVCVNSFFRYELGDVFLDWFHFCDETRQSSD